MAALTPETMPAGDGRATANMIRSTMARASTGFAITPKPSANLYILLQARLHFALICNTCTGLHGSLCVVSQLVCGRQSLLPFLSLLAGLIAAVTEAASWRPLHLIRLHTCTMLERKY